MITNSLIYIGASYDTSKFVLGDIVEDKVYLVPKVTTIERMNLARSFGSIHTGYKVYDTDIKIRYSWNVSEWNVYNDALASKLVINTNTSQVAIDISHSNVPVSGNVLVATSPTLAEWKVLDISQISGFTDTAVNSKLLTGYSLGTDDQLLATDSIIGAFGKLQTQVNLKAEVDTGLVSGGILSINGSDNTKFDVSALVACFGDHSNPVIPTGQYIPYGPTYGITLTNIATQNVTYIGINVTGIIIQQADPFTNIQRRTIVSLGAIVHSNRININAINYIGATNHEPLLQLQDFMYAVGPLNIDGNVYSFNGVNLNINKTSGSFFKFGSNYQNNMNDPHVIGQSSGTALTFRYRLNTGTEYANITAIDPNNYDLAGVLTPTPNNKFTIQRIFLFQSGLTRLQYGQTIYNSISEAIAAFGNSTFTVEQNIKENGILRAWMVVKQGTTDLTDTTKAAIFDVSKFGSVIGSGGSSSVTYAQIIAALGFTPLPTDPELVTIAALANSPGYLYNNGSGVFSYTSPAGSGTVTSVDMTVPTGLTISGNPIITTGTLALTLTTGYSIPTTSSQTNWDTAYTDRLKWDGGSSGLTATTGRISLGATTTGSNLFTLVDPAAITFIRINADNSISTLDAATFRTAIGAGTSSTIGTVTSIATTSPITGGTITTTGTIGIQVANTTQDGYLTASDWNLFSGKQVAYTNLTTVGALVNASGWLHNDGTGIFVYSTPTKSDVGLSAVENTALSTWAGTTNLTTLGTVITGTWNGSLIAGQYGGTGVANTGKTITLGGNLTTSGAFTTTLTVTGNTGVTLPTSGTLIANPMSVLGDIIYGGIAGVPTQLAGSIVNGIYVLSATTASSTAGIPIWLLSTGTGNNVLSASPILTGNTTVGTINKIIFTAPATSATLTIADGKTLTASNTLTFSGTDGSTLNIGTGGTLGTGAYTTAYVLPTATSTVLGGVKPDGTSILNASGVLSATIASVIGYTPINKAGDTGIGALTYANNNFHANATYEYWKDSGGTDRRILGLNATNETFVGAIDTGYGASTYVNAGTTLWLRTDGSSGSFTNSMTLTSLLATLNTKVSITDTTAATSATTGSLINSGGFGNSGDASIGGRLALGFTGTNTTALLTLGSGAAIPGATGVTQYGLSITPTPSSASTTGYMGIYVQARTAAAAYTSSTLRGLHIDTPSIGAGSTATTYYTISTNNATGAGTNYQLYLGTGISVFNDTTDSTSTTTGSFQTKGGAAITKALWVGGLSNIAGVLTAANTTTSTTPTSGSLQVVGGAGFGENINVAGRASIGTGVISAGTLLYLGGATEIPGVSGATQYGILLNATPSSAATSSYTGIYVQPRSAAAAYTASEIRGLYVESPSIGAGSTVTSAFAIRTNNVTGAGANYQLYLGTGVSRFLDTTLSSFSTSGSILLSGSLAASIADVSTSGTHYGQYTEIDATYASASTASSFGIRGVSLATATCAATSGGMYGGYFVAQNLSTSNVSTLRGVAGIATASSSGGGVNAFGSYSESTINGSGNWSTSYGAYSVFTCNTSGTITSATVFHASNTLTAGTVTNLRGINVLNLTCTGLTSTTTVTGIEVGNINAASVTPATNAYALKTGNVTGAGTNYQLNLGTGISVFNDTTDSTSTTTGSFQTKGGAAITKALWVGGLGNFASTVTATQFNGSGAGLTGTAASLTAGAVSSITSGQVTTALGFTPEPALGNPAANGYVLSSTTAGARSWINPGTNGFPPWWGFTSFTAPLVSAFTWLDQGTCTATDKTACLYFACPANSGDHIRGMIKSLPATPYTIDMAFTSGAGAAFNGQSIIIRNSSSGKFITMDMYGNGNEIPYLRVVSWNSTTSASTVLATSRRLNLRDPVFFRITDDGTTRTFLFALDGQNFESLLSHVNTTWITPDQVGFCDTHNDAVNKTSMSILNFTIS